MQGERAGRKERSGNTPVSIKALKRIVTIMNRAQLAELDIEQEGIKIHLRKGPLPGEGQQPAAAPAMSPSAPAATGPAAAPSAPPAPSEEANWTTITSPMVGTFYRAPSPDAPPYVSEGSAVEEGTVVCIVEAMKLMNEIKAEVQGVVRRILVENAQAVEFGQPLFQVERRG